MTQASENHQDIPAAEDAAAERTAENASASASAGEGIAAALAAAEARVAELEAQLAELNDKSLRALADADNTRKRLEKERQDTAKFAVSSFARDVLSVADNLGRALAAITPEQRTQDGPLKTIFAGVEATERELLRVMENQGIKKVDCLGQAFDPNLHEVMFEIEAPDQKPGTILQVLEPAYTIHDRLLRSARVGVAKGGIASEGSQLDQSV
ncbi:MAG: nucleotide exchange factor GrpE [Bdellovibrionales bacterium]|jgi:molecular chaperone GrpE|nr:nucleotide exchange factor GrpE [Bdellovibrionales bacterium]